MGFDVEAFPGIKGLGLFDVALGIFNTSGKVAQFGAGNAFGSEFHFSCGKKAGLVIYTSFEPFEIEIRNNFKSYADVLDIVADFCGFKISVPDTKDFLSVTICLVVEDKGCGFELGNLDRKIECEGCGL